MNMQSPNKFLLILTMVFSLGITACANNDAEDVGEEIDEAATDAGNAIEDACEKATDQDC